MFLTRILLEQVLKYLEKEMMKNEKELKLSLSIGHSFEGIIISLDVRSTTIETSLIIEYNIKHIVKG